MKKQLSFGVAAIAAVGVFAAAGLTGCGSSSGSVPIIGASSAPPRTYKQIDRLSRPVVNEVFASVAGNRHKTNDEISPTQDAASLKNDITNFMTNTAGRSQAITNVVATVLIPDVLVADLDKAAPAAYLGVETGGATGGTFGGRKLTDDVVDISLGVVFGNTVSALGLAADDGKEIPALTSDNVGPGAKHYTSTFPYLGAPQ